MDGQMDTMLIAISPKPIGRGNKNEDLWSLFYTIYTFLFSYTIYGHFSMYQYMSVLIKDGYLANMGPVVQN